MKFLNAFLLFASLSLVNTSASGFTLQIVQGNYTWYEAKLDAETRGGRLAILDTQDKISAANSYLSLLGAWPRLWLGATDNGNEGNWIWIDGNEMTESNWFGGEPNGGLTVNYLQLIDSESFNALQWNDANTAGGYVLESVPEPSNYALLLGGLALGLVALRRR